LKPSWTTQEDVGLARARKRAQRAVAHQPEVRVVRNDLGAQPLIK